MTDPTSRDLAAPERLEARRVEALGRLVAGIAHELNNPLTAILTFAEQLRADATSAADRIALESIHSQAVRARAIVADLLAFVRDDHGRPLVATRTVTIVERATQALRPHLTLLGIEVVADLADDDVWIDADVATLEQAVTSLLLNAAYVVGGGGHVRVRADSTGRDAMIVVEDDGPGIDPASALHLFEPFFTTKPAGQGTGLGLFVAMGIAKRHGGEIRAENRTGDGERGARFTVRLPRVPSPLPAPARLEPDATASKPVPRVLIVDDEAAIRLSLSRFFARRGWVVAEAANGREALAILRTATGNHYSLILCDLRMPEMGGAELHAILEAEQPEVLARLVLVSGDVVSAEAAALLRSTRCRLVEKPFELAALGKLADGMLANQAREDEARES